MVLQVHGGPWCRDTWGYNPLHQWLANRGYAVLSVNFRGSTGFGKQFVNAGNREWAGKMHDDLHRRRRNGPSTKASRTRQDLHHGRQLRRVRDAGRPDVDARVFACGVDDRRPVQSGDAARDDPPYWTPQIEFSRPRVGDHRTPEGREFLLERSPITYVDRIKKPLLIGQGANDPRVKQSESDQIVAAMQEAGIPVTYVLYPDEGHGFARPQNRRSFYAVSRRPFSTNTWAGALSRSATTLPAPA